MNDENSGGWRDLPDGIEEMVALPLLPDNEVTAISSVYDALLPVSKKGRDRVLSYICDRFDIPGVVL